MGGSVGEDAGGAGEGEGDNGEAVGSVDGEEDDVVLSVVVLLPFVGDWLGVSDGNTEGRALFAVVVPSTAPPVPA